VSQIATAKDNGTYKIEIDMMPRGGKNPLIPGRIHILRSGSSVDGDNDEPVFACPKCKKLVLPEHTMSGYFSCVHCGEAGDTEFLSEGSMANLSLEKWADLILTYWHKVGGDADLYLKRYKRRMRDVSKDPNFDKALKGIMLAKSQKELVIYPLKNLMKDNLSGADMRKRVLAFLRA
jgi:hypothetical protein